MIEGHLLQRWDEQEATLGVSLLARRQFYVAIFLGTIARIATKRKSSIFHVQICLCSFHCVVSISVYSSRVVSDSRMWVITT